MALGDASPPLIDLTNLPVFVPSDPSTVIPGISDTLSMPVPLLPPPTVATLPTTTPVPSAPSSYVWVVAGLGLLYVLGMV